SRHRPLHREWNDRSADLAPGARGRRRSDGCRGRDVRALVDPQAPAHDRPARDRRLTELSPSAHFALTPAADPRRMTTRDRTAAAGRFRILAIANETVEG